MILIRVILCSFICTLCSHITLAQYKHKLEIKLGLGQTEIYDNNNFTDKGFVIEQSNRRTGKVASFALDYNFKYWTAEYFFRSFNIQNTNITNEFEGNNIGEGTQEMNLIQNGLGAKYHFPNLSSRLSVFIAGRISYNFIELSQTKITNTINLEGSSDGTVPAATITWTNPATSVSFGAIGYELTAGLKFLFTEKTGIFCSIGKGQIIQDKTELIGDRSEYLISELGICFRFIKKQSQ